MPDARETLPLPDLPTMSLGQLRGKLRVLDVAELATLLEYERAHGNRFPFITMMENRIAKVSAEQQADRALPSGDGSGGTSGRQRSGATGARRVAAAGDAPTVEDQVDEASAAPTEQPPPATKDAEDGGRTAGSKRSAS